MYSLVKWNVCKKYSPFEGEIFFNLVICILDVSQSNIKGVVTLLRTGQVNEA